MINWNKVYDIKNRLSGFNLTLRHKLLVLFFIITLPFLVFIVFTFSLVRKTVSSQMDSYQKAVVVSVNKLIEHYILNCQKSLTTLASEKNFRYAVSVKKRDLINLNLKRVFVKYKNFSFLGIVGRRNNKFYMLSSYPDDYSTITEYEEIYNYLKYSFNNPSVRISNAYNFRDKKEVILVYPLRGALLIGGIDLNNLSQLLEKVKPIEESRFIILDPNSGIIMGEGDKFEHKLPDSEGVIKYGKDKNLAYYVKNESINWQILLSSPYRVIYRSSIYMGTLAIIIVILGISTALFLASYFSKKVTQPISALNKGAQILGSGNLSYRIMLNTGDEIEELAKEFNKMGEELEKSYDSLGEKIKNATRNLENAYKEIEEKNVALRKADKMKSEFLASMSHELRTPMNAIIGFTALLSDEVYGKVSKKQKETYEKIMRSTNHLLKLINDILDLSKIEAGRIKLIPEKFRVDVLLKELSEEVKPLAMEKNLEFILNMENDIQCFNDYLRVRQVIMNLLSNAIKFTKEGKVEIKAGKLTEGFFVEVSDTGIGIKQEDLEHIFDEFVQADGSVTREFGGTGLGLSISRKLVNMMGGKIEVKSELEKGTVFKVILPYENKAEKVNKHVSV
ncbi:MAG: HAMP domain-containing protein [Elusimicrobia bacterium]|nr:HAMP domain-containing protein [Elusimicrobiota bacterium]